MGAFLGVPILCRDGTNVGNLYLGRKPQARFIQR